MKKVLVVLLSLCMVLGCFSFAFATDYTDVADDNKYADAIDVLSGLSILEGDGNGLFRPNAELKRSEAAVVLVKLLGQGAYASEQTATKFSDVPASHWASGWIAYAANLGLIEGDGDGTFAPDRNLSYNEWLTMVMRAIGYKDQNLAGDWPTNFIVKASSIGLVDASLTGTKAMTRAEMAQVAYNSLAKPAVSYQTTITGEANEILSDGVGGNPGPSNFLTKNGVDVVSAADLTTKNAAGVVPATATGVLADYVGQNGYAYKKGADVITFVPVANQVELSGKFDNTAGTLTTADKTVYTLAGTPLYIRNGAALAATDLNGKDVVAYGTVAGKTLTASSLQGWYVDGYVKVDDATNATTNTTALNAEKTAKTGTVALKFQDATNTGVTLTFATKEGAPVLAVNDLKDQDVLSYYATTTGGTAVAKYDVCNDVASGSITKITGTAPNQKYTVSGTDYSSVKALTMDGKTYSWYLTSDGKLFDVVPATAPAPAPKDYAVITTDAAKTTDSAYASSSYVYNIELLTADGKTAVYVINKDYAEKDTTWKADAIVTGSGTTALAKGAIVSYVLKNGEITKLAIETADTTVTGTGKTWNAKTGIFGGKLMSDKVAVVYNKTTAPASVKIDKVASIPSDLSTGVAAYLDGGKVAFVVLTNTTPDAAPPVTNVGLIASNKVTEVWDSSLSTPATVYQYSAIVDGAVTTLVSKTPLNLTSDYVVGDLYKLTITDGYLTAKAALPYAATKVSGTVSANATDSLVSIGGTYYALKNPVVYVKTVDTTVSPSAVQFSVGDYTSIVKGATVDIYESTTPTVDVYNVVYVTVTK